VIGGQSCVGNASRPWIGAFQSPNVMNESRRATWSSGPCGRLLESCVGGSDQIVMGTPAAVE
jgi:hypothetical protein